MVASTWIQNPGRQDVLTAMVEIDHADMAATSGGTPATGTYEVINMPKGSRVVGGLAIITEAFPASVTLEVGDGDDTDRYLDTAGDAPGTAVFPAASSIGEQTLNDVAYLVPGKEYTSSDTIDVVVAGAAPTASGKLLLIVNYVIEGRSAFAQK